MNSKLKNMVNIVLLLIVMQTLLLIWNTILRQLFANKDIFTNKMITMSGMVMLTVGIIIYFKRMNIKLSFIPEYFSRRYWIGTILAILFLIATPSNYIDGIRGPMVLFYASIVTPLYEELLFRGYVWNKLTDICTSDNQIAWINATMFAIWHIGYIIDALIAGQWMALSKLVIGFAYGMVLSIVRMKTKNCYSTFLVHGVLNAFLG